jgi:sortase B
MKIKKFLYPLIMAILITVFLFSGYQLVTIYLEYRNGEQEYEELAEYADIPVKEDQNKKEDTEDQSEENTDEEEAGLAEVNFEELNKINPEIAGWIFMENSVINYPVLHTADNEYYLNHTFRRKTNSSGSIFIECGNQNDFSDQNTIIYGHNMKNGSMFASLNKYKEKSYYDGHQGFWIYTEAGNYYYEIFSVYETEPLIELYQISFASTEDFADYLNLIAGKSFYDTGVEVSDSDTIVTLSTCAKSNRENRILVHAKKISFEQ